MVDAADHVRVSPVGLDRGDCYPFLLRQDRIYTAAGYWTLTHRRWLANR
jgi:hypothetical protein